MLIVSALALSCREEHPVEIAGEDSPERPVVDDFFGRLKPNNENEMLGLLELKNAIDFRSFHRYKITSNEDVWIADVINLDFEHGSTLKALFFIQNGEVVRSNLVAFSNSSADHNNLIVSILNRRFDPFAYDGKIAFYNLFRDVLFFNVTEQGRLTSNGIAQSRPGSKANSSGRTEGCTDWFLITTYHYAGGGSSTEELYLTTTCGGDCQSTRMQGRVSCGGGDYAGTYDSYGPALPDTPANGDQYTFTDPDGKTTVYMFDQALRTWIVYMVVLPEYTVQSSPLSYPYLLTNGPPSHFATMYGPDGFLYIYNAWAGVWEGGSNFSEDGGGPDVVIRDRADYFRCIKTRNPAILTIYVDQPSPGSTIPVAGTDVGHSWISITQTIDGNTVTRVFGYYPLDGASPMDPRDTGALVNDGAHEYDVSVSVPLTPREVIQLLSYTINHVPAIYDLNSFNCTDFVVDACRAANVYLPENRQSWIGGGGLCPGQLGEDLRTYDIPSKTETRDLDGGIGPTNTGGC